MTRNSAWQLLCALDDGGFEVTLHARRYASSEPAEYEVAAISTSAMRFDLEDLKQITAIAERHGLDVVIDQHGDAIFRPQ